MSEPKPGQLIEGGDHGRDAIHIAVAPVEAGMALHPGDHIGFLGNGTAGKVDVPIGIVDPYLLEPVVSGDKFWMFLYPKTVTGLRHDWTHPAFSTQSGNKDEAERWLRDYAVRVNPYVENPDDAFQNFITNARRGEMFYSGRDLHESQDVVESKELFRYLSVYLGRPVSEGDFNYGCSC